METKINTADNRCRVNSAILKSLNQRQMLEQASEITSLLDFALKYVLIPLGSAIVGGISGGVVGYRKAQKDFHEKKEGRLFANVQRPVGLIPTKDDPMELEYRLLEKVDFFKPDLLPADPRSLDDISDKYRLVVIRYEKKSSFWKIFNALAARAIPLIIYAKPGEIPRDDLEKIQDSYTRYTLCNTPVRLLSDVYAIMSVYPEEAQDGAQ